MKFARLVFSGLVLALLLTELRAENPEPEQQPAGVLALVFDFKYKNVLNGGASAAFPFLQISVSGASADDMIKTRLHFLPDLVFLGHYFSGNASFLKAGQTTDFSFGSLNSLYRLAGSKNMSFLAGFELGHRGFLTAGSQGYYSLYAGPSALFMVYAGRHFLLQATLTVPVNLVHPDVKSIFLADSSVELLFEPQGKARSPSGSSVFFAAGCDLNYYWLENKTAGVFTAVNLQPFMKFYLLY